MRTLVSVNVITALWIGIWCAGFILTHVPIEPGGPIRIPHLDKIGHVTLFFLITLLGGLRLNMKSGPTIAAKWLTWGLIYLGYGAFDELTQPLTGRDADMTDWLFDAAGVLLATLALWRITRRAPFRV